MKVYSLFLITSGYVWSAIVEFKKGGVSAIIHSESIPLPISEKLDKEKLERDTLSATALAAANLAVISKEKNVLLSGNIVVLGAPWYIGETKIINQSYKRNTTIRQDLLDSLTKEQINNFEEENSIHDAVILEKKITNITLNGYTTLEPFNKKANSLAFSLFFSLTTKNLKAKLDEIFEKELQYKEQYWHSLPIFLFGSLINQTDQASHVNDFLILDVGAEVSEISIVREKSFLETASIPFGSNHMVRAVSDKLKMTIPLASSLLRLQKEGGSNEINNSRLSDIFLSQESPWKALLLPSLLNLAGGLSLPTTLYLICDSDTKKFFKQTLEKEDYVESALSGSKFSIVEIDFKNFCNSLSLTI